MFFIIQLILPYAIRAAGKTVEGINKGNESSQQKTKDDRTKIVVNDLKTAEIRTKLMQEGVTANFENGRQGKTVINLMAKDKQKVVKVLVETNHSGHGYVTKEERIFSIMLKGIGEIFTAEEVKRELEEKLQLDENAGKIQVDRHQTLMSAQKGLSLPMFVVKTEDKATLDLVTSINTLLWCRTKWEKIHKKIVTICYNCYEEGHSMSGGCFKQRQCKRCPAKGHHECKVEKVAETDDEGRKQNPYKNYVCCNCKQSGHPLTWSGCSVMKERMERAERSRDERIQRRVNFQPAPPPRVNVWAERRTQKETQVEKEERREERRGGFEETVKELLGLEAIELQKMARECVEKLGKCKTQQEKKAEIALYFLKVNGLQTVW